MNIGRILKICIALLMLIIGGLIYVGFRSETLLMFRWFRCCGVFEYVAHFRETCLGCDLPYFVRYSLPDGLWLLSYMIIIGTIWNKNKSIQYLIFVYAMPIIAIIIELLQYYFTELGTFDILDIIAYTAAIIIYKLIQHLI